MRGPASDYSDPIGSERALDFCFGVFSSREPASASLENARA